MLGAEAPSFRSLELSSPTDEALDPEGWPTPRVLLVGGGAPAAPPVLGASSGFDSGKGGGVLSNGSNSGGISLEELANVEWLLCGVGRREARRRAGLRVAGGGAGAQRRGGNLLSCCTLPWLRRQSLSGAQEECGGGSSRRVTASRPCAPTDGEGKRSDPFESGSADPEEMTAPIRAAMAAESALSVGDWATAAQQLDVVAGLPGDPCGARALCGWALARFARERELSDSAAINLRGRWRRLRTLPLLVEVEKGATRFKKEVGRGPPGTLVVLRRVPEPSEMGGWCDTEEVTASARMSVGVRREAGVSAWLRLCLPAALWARGVSGTPLAEALREAAASEGMSERGVEEVRATVGALVSYSS